MLNTDTELIFPIRVISALRNLRGPLWQEFIDRLGSSTASEVDLVSFTYLIAKMGGCHACNADSFRAMRGCTQCARMTVRRYKNSDSELIELYHSARKEVEEFLGRINTSLS